MEKQGSRLNSWWWIENRVILVIQRRMEHHLHPVNPRHRFRIFKKNAVRILACGILFDRWSAELVVSDVRTRIPIHSWPILAFDFLASSNSVISSIIGDESSLENEAASKHLDIMTTDDARLDIKQQVKHFATNFIKKCSNKTTSIETLIQDYGAFKDAIKKRLQTNSIYRGRRVELNDWICWLI